MRLDSALDGAAAEAGRNRGGGCVDGLVKPGRVARLDFVSERGAGTEGDRRIARRLGATAQSDRLNLDAREASVGQLLSYQVKVVVGVGVRRRNAGGSSGNSSATASLTAMGISFSSMRSQVLKMKRPSGVSTRSASR